MCRCRCRRGAVSCTVHIVLLFAVECRVSIKCPAHLVSQRMDRAAGSSLPGHCSTVSLSLPDSHIWKCVGGGWLTGAQTFYSYPFSEVYATKSREWPEGTHLCWRSHPEFRIAVETGKGSTLCHKPFWESVCGDVSVLTIF